MAMPFVAPVPWEADAFYAQDGMTDNGLSLNQWPVGTGPYMMTEFVRDRRHVMKRNPNYRGEPYPCEGEAGDAEARPPRRLRQDHAFHRHALRDDRKGKGAAQGEVQAGLSRRARDRTAGMGRRLPQRRQQFRRGEEALRRAGFPVSAQHRHHQLVSRLQHARSGGRLGQDARGAGEAPKAAPGHLHRHRLGRRLRPHLPEQGRDRRAQPAAALASSARAKGRATSTTR